MLISGWIMIVHLNQNHLGIVTFYEPPFQWSVRSQWGHYDLPKHVSIHIYIYIYVHICLIYWKLTQTSFIFTYIYIYSYTYTYIYIYMCIMYIYIYNVYVIKASDCTLSCHEMILAISLSCRATSFDQIIPVPGLAMETAL